MMEAMIAACKISDGAPAWLSASVVGGAVERLKLSVSNATSS